MHKGLSGPRCNIQAERTLLESINLNQAANNLYRTLRKIKNNGFKSIIVNKIPNTGIGLAINDRLKKASYK